MEMILADNNVDEEYVEWIVRREAAVKQVIALEDIYVHVFGKLMEENYRWKSACKYLQKSLEYCSDHKNMEIEQMEFFVKKEMEQDLHQWMLIQERVNSVQFIPFISQNRLKEIETLFRKIVNKLQSKNDPLYGLAQRAYLENDIKTLWKINDHLKRNKSQNYIFMEEETKTLKREVREINKRVKYYTEVLNSADRIQKKNKEIIEDTKSYKYYQKVLKRKLRKTLKKTAGMQSFVFISSFRGNDLIIVPNDDPLLLGTLPINLRFQV